MFTDERSKKLVLVSHCILNQNSISDATADFPGTFEEIVKLFLDAKVGIIQMPCPELMCLGLARGDVHGGERGVLVENSRIRENMKSAESLKIIDMLVEQVLFQIEEYLKNGFTILGIVGVNRSPSCGISTTSKDSQEVEGKGVYMERLEKVLEEKNIHIDMIGTKTSEPEKSVASVKALLYKTKE